MTDKQMIYNCPHISFTDWGTYACKLYNPRDKNCLVKGGNCDSNISCPYKQLKRKEQECERLNNIINEAKNSKLDLKSFLVGEAVQNEYEQQLEAYKMEAEEGKEINAELKADNKHLNDLLNQALKELEEMRELKDTESLQACILTRENERLKELLAQDQCFQNKSHKCVKSFYIDERYKQAIEKIKEICTKYKEICANCDGDGYIDCIDCTEGGEAQAAIKILQICDEVTNV